MNIHNLKILPKYYQAVQEGNKTFEVRKDDRDFQVDDYINLEEWNGQYTGNSIVKQITYILGREEDEKIYVPEGYIILRIK